MTYRLKKSFNNILGVDLRVSDLLRSDGAATDVDNVMYRQTGALSKRKGFQYKTPKSNGGSGLIKYNNIDISTGVITEELLTVDDDLNIYTTSTFTITYTGSNTAYYDMYLNAADSKFYFDIYDNNSRVLNADLGTGEGASDTTVSALVSTINGLTNFTCSVTGSPTNPAAFIDIATNTSISSSGTTVNFYDWTAVTTPNGYTTPFSTHWAARNDTDFELVTHATVNDVLFIANGYDELHKYDGNRVYRAGLPTPATPSAADIAGTTFSAGEVYQYKYIYEYTDAKGNILTGNLSAAYSHTVGAGTNDIDVTVSNLQEDQGFNTDQAVVNGAQNSVNTITVDAGHDLQVNDNVYLYDGSTSTYVSRKVTATASTTITINGNAVDVADNAVISCLKIYLYRTTDGGSLYYLVTELINDTDNNTQTYTDQTADGSLGAEFTPPVKERDLPPKARYIDVWRGQLVLTGDRENVNKVYYSDIESPEYFPQPANEFLVAAKLGGGNTGLKVLDNTLFVFKPESVITVSGDFGTDVFRVDTFSDEGIGCIAHATIKEIGGRVWFLGNKGVYSASSDNIRLESNPIEPKFSETSFNTKQAVSFHWIDRDMYVLLLPVISTDGSSEDYFGSTSVILVYDKFRQAWLEWSSFNFLGGMAEFNDEIYISGRRLDPADSAAKNYHAKILETGTEADYADHENAISFTYKSHWEALGEPSVFKKFLRLKLLSLDGSINDFETDDFSVDITTEHDYLPSTVSSLTLDMSGGSAGWGAGAWGSFPWGEARLEAKGSKLASKKAKSLRVIFANSNLKENVLISGYELEIAAPYDMAIKE